MSSILRNSASRANGAKSRGPVTAEGKRISARNTAHSTGPVTPEGKARSSQNALRHGLLAKAVVLPDECPETFEASLAALREELQPQTFTENEFVEIIAIANWRRRRLWHIEGAHYTRAILSRQQADDAGADPGVSANPSMRTALAFGSLCEGSNILRNLHRYEVRFSREFTRHLLLYEARRRAGLPQPNFSKRTEPGEPAG